MSAFDLHTHLNRYKENYYLMIGHFATDICQGSIGAALTVLFASGRLHSNMEVSLLVLASTLLSSIVQPIIGFISDLKPRPYLMATGMLTAAAGLMFIGFVTDFWLLFILISMSGVGVAIFHPEGGKTANAVSKEHKGRGVSIFSVGGNLGFAAGPLVISGATLLFGLPGIMAIGLPSIITGIFFISRNRHYTQLARSEIKRRKHEASEQDDYFGFSILTLMIFFRSSVLFGLTSFIPLYFMEKFNLEPQAANLNLTIVATCAAVASLAGGALADRFGFKQVQCAAALLSVPFLAIFCLMPNALLSTIILIPAAVSIYGTLSVSMVMGQKFLCNRMGFASGITIGLGITFGGITSPIFGWIGDTWGLQYTMWAVTIAAVLTGLLSIIVPDIDAIRAKKRLSLNDQA